MFALVRNLALLALVFLLGYLFGVKGLRFYVITSSSMEPAFVPGDRLISERPDVLARKDVVVLEDPRGTGGILTKRIVGLPGDRIEISDGTVRVNGERMEEPYVQERAEYRLSEKIPDKHYFVLGDNRNRSEDSSNWGPVEARFIRGRVVARYWPFSRLALF